MYYIRIYIYINNYEVSKRLDIGSPMPEKNVLNLDVEEIGYCKVIQSQHSTNGQTFGCPKRGWLQWSAGTSKPSH